MSGAPASVWLRFASAAARASPWWWTRSSARAAALLLPVPLVYVPGSAHLRGPAQPGADQPLAHGDGLRVVVEPEDANLLGHNLECVDHRFRPFGRVQRAGSQNKVPVVVGVLPA